MNSAPKPWDELMKRLKLSSKPMESGSDWFTQVRCSSSQPLCYWDFIQFLASPQPCIDAATDRMTMNPRILLMTSRTRCLLLSFFKLISTRIPARDLRHLTETLEKLFRKSRDETALYYVRLLTSSGRRNSLSSGLRQRFDGKMTDVVEGLDLSRLGHETRAMMDKSRVRQSENVDAVIPVSDVTLELLAPCKKLPAALKRAAEEEQPGEDCKRRKIEVDVVEETEKFDRSSPQITLSVVDDVKRMIEKKATDELLTFLTDQSEAILERIFEKVEVPESSNVIIDLFEKTDKSKEKLFARMLKYLVLPYLCQLQKSINRALLNHCIKLTKNSANFSLLYLITPLIHNIPVMNKAHVSFLVSCTKTISDKELKVSVLSATLDRCERGDLPDSDLDVIVQFLQNLLDLNLLLSEVQLARLVSFFTLAISDHPELFALSKLILTFIKKFASKLDSDVLDEIAAVVAIMKTSLKKVCENTLQKMTKR